MCVSYIYTLYTHVIIVTYYLEKLMQYDRAVLVGTTTEWVWLMNKYRLKSRLQMTMKQYWLDITQAFSMWRFPLHSGYFNIFKQFLILLLRNKVSLFRRWLITGTIMHGFSPVNIFFAKRLINQHKNIKNFQLQCNW